MRGGRQKERPDPISFDAPDVENEVRPRSHEIRSGALWGITAWNGRLQQNYLLELARYVVLNPIRAGMVGSPGQWRWGSYRAMVGAEAAPEWLETRSILAAFGPDESEAVGRYVRFVAEGKGIPSPWARLKHQVFLGSDAFVERMMRKVPRGRDLREVPQSKARPRAKPLAAYVRTHPQRDRAIAEAYASGGYTMQEIGDYFGLHYSRVSKIVRAEAEERRRAKGKT